MIQNLDDMFSVVIFREEVLYFVVNFSFFKKLDYKMFYYFFSVNTKNKHNRIQNMKRKYNKRRQFFHQKRRQRQRMVQRRRQNLKNKQKNTKL